MTTVEPAAVTAVDRVLVQAGARECARIARHEARTFYLAFCMLPPARRHAIHAVYAFSRAVDDVADDPALDEDEKRRRLDLHRRSLDGVYGGTPRTPRLAALADAVTRHGIPREMLETLVDGVQMDVTPRRHRDLAELRTYCHAVAGVVGQMCVRIFGAHEARADDLADELGFALQLTNILRDLAEDAGNDRFYLPLDELEAAGLDEAALLRHRGERGTPAARYLTLQGERAAAAFGAVDELMPLVPRFSRPCLAGIAQLYRAMLVRLRELGYPADGPRVRLRAGEKLAVAGRAAVRGITS